MIIVVWVFALLTALIHIVVFTWESFLMHRPFVHEKIFAVPESDLPALRLWTFGLGFYNLFLGLGLVAGVILWATGNEIQGQTLVIYLSIVALLCGVVLFIGDRRGLARKKGSMTGGAFTQAVPPLITLVAVALL